MNSYHTVVRTGEQAMTIVAKSDRNNFRTWNGQVQEFLPRGHGPQPDCTRERKVVDPVHATSSHGFPIGSKGERCDVPLIPLQSLIQLKYSSAWTGADAFPWESRNKQKRRLNADFDQRLCRRVILIASQRKITCE